MFTSTNPATGEKIATYEKLSDDGLEAAIAGAETAFRDWRTADVAERAAAVGRIGDAFEANRNRLAELATKEMGKTLTSAKAEVDKCVAAFRHYAKDGPGLLEPREVAGGKAEMHYLPLGPILAVMPWNFPFWQVVRFMAPNLVAGNVGLLKHASNVQGTAAAIEDMVREAGLPDGVFANLAISSDRVKGIIQDQRVRGVTLTGSEPAGRAVAEVAGAQVKPVVLELGGSDPFIVMPSADFDDAVEQAVKARIQNTGQSCICGKRMIVHADIYDRFADAFTQGMLDAKAGDPMDDATDMGPLSSEDQRQTVKEQLEKAREAGASVTGAIIPDSEGAFMQGGVITAVEIGSDLMEEEIFGPVAMLFKAADIDEALEIANAVPFGLGSAVFTQDEREQARFVRDIEAGMTAFNQVLASDPAVPFGGIKNSGVGRELGAPGMHEFLNLKTVMRA